MESNFLFNSWVSSLLIDHCAYKFFCREGVKLAAQFANFPFVACNLFFGSSDPPADNAPCEFHVSFIANMI